MATGLASCSNNTSGSTYSEGYRTGVVTKFSRKGLMNKSWEGQLATSGFTEENSAMTNNFEFTVKDEDTATIRKINEMQDAGTRVKLHYKQVFWHNNFASETGYFVDGVSPLAGKADIKIPQP